MNEVKDKSSKKSLNVTLTIICRSGSDARGSFAEIKKISLLQKMEHKRPVKPKASVGWRGG